ncbi:MAG TPA: DUF3667 domain-containing protein [Bacteroidetes bacterium]|nr:DUF3667 domain-containing protein [Bacteroidota bacterium]
MNSEKRCVTCSAVLHGPYCCQCGEKVVNPEDYTVRRFLRELGAQIFNIDGRMLKSFRLLLSKPGFLTRAYLDGQRKPWLKPIQIFLISNIIYFFSQPLTHVSSFNTSLNSHLNRQVYSPIIQKVIKPESRDNFSAYEKRFNALTKNFARSFIFMLIPLCAIMLYWADAGRKRYFFPYLVFSTHFLAFYLLVAFSLLMVAITSIRPVLNEFSTISKFLYSEQGITVIFWGIFYAYMYAALQRVFGESRRRAATKAVALYFLLTFILYQIYRFLLFWLVYIRLLW